MHLRPPPPPTQWLRLLFILRRWFCCCRFIVYCCSHCRGSVFGPCFVMHYSVSFLVFQSSWCGRESWLLYLSRLPDVLWLLVFCGTSSRCRGLVCCVWLWYFPIKFAYFLLSIFINYTARNAMLTLYIFKSDHILYFHLLCPFLPSRDRHADF